MYDVLVVGSGPAGLTAARHVAQTQRSTVLVAPACRARWTNNYGAWQDDLTRLGYTDIARHVWPRSRVSFGARGHRILDRAYVQIDAEKLQDRLWSEADRAGLHVVEDSVTEVIHKRSFSKVVTERGSMEARIVIDASGHKAGLVHRPKDSNLAAQVAYGVLAEVDNYPLPRDEMLFMDLSDPGPMSDGPPTFLYAMPFAPPYVFLEETSLVSRPPMSFDALQARLRERLRRMNIQVTEVHEIERCFIPMGGPIPTVPQRVVGFGGSAGMVHPATGYMLTAVLEAAPALAEALDRGLTHAPDDPDIVAQTAWEAVWPVSFQRSFALFQFGMNALLKQSADGVRTFFDAFFATPEPAWRDYLAGRIPPARVAEIMTGVFLRAPVELKQALVLHGLSPSGWALMTALVR